MRYETTGYSSKVTFEEGDYQRRLERRSLAADDFLEGGKLICTERGKCYSEPRTSRARLEKDEPA